MVEKIQEKIQEERESEDGVASRVLLAALSGGPRPSAHCLKSERLP